MNGAPGQQIPGLPRSHAPKLSGPAELFPPAVAVLGVVRTLCSRPGFLLWAARAAAGPWP